MECGGFKRTFTEYKKLILEKKSIFRVPNAIQKKGSLMDFCSSSYRIANIANLAKPAFLWILQKDILKSTYYHYR